MVNVDGQVFAIFVMAVAAAEVAVGLALIISVYRNRRTVNLDEMDILRGSERGCARLEGGNGAGFRPSCRHSS